MLSCPDSGQYHSPVDRERIAKPQRVGTSFALQRRAELTTENGRCRPAWMAVDWTTGRLVSVLERLPLAVLLAPFRVLGNFVMEWIGYGLNWQELLRPRFDNLYWWSSWDVRKKLKIAGAYWRIWYALDKLIYVMLLINTLIVLLLFEYSSHVWGISMCTW